MSYVFKYLKIHTKSKQISFKINIDQAKYIPLSEYYFDKFDDSLDYINFTHRISLIYITSSIYNFLNEQRHRNRPNQSIWSVNKRVLYRMVFTEKELLTKIHTL